MENLKITKTEKEIKKWLDSEEYLFMDDLASADTFIKEVNRRVQELQSETDIVKIKEQALELALDARTAEWYKLMSSVREEGWKFVKSLIAGMEED